MTSRHPDPGGWLPPHRLEPRDRPVTGVSTCRAPSVQQQIFHSETNCRPSRKIGEARPPGSPGEQISPISPLLIPSIISSACVFALLTR